MNGESLNNPDTLNEIQMINQQIYKLQAKIDDYSKKIVLLEKENDELNDLYNSISKVELQIHDDIEGYICQTRNTVSTFATNLKFVRTYYDSMRAILEGKERQASNEALKKAKNKTRSQVLNNDEEIRILRNKVNQSYREIRKLEQKITIIGG